LMHLRPPTESIQRGSRLTDRSIERAAPHHEPSNRHMQFIAISSAISAGLFIGPGASIEGAESSVLIARVGQDSDAIFEAIMAENPYSTTVYDEFLGQFIKPREMVSEFDIVPLKQKVEHE